MSPKSRHRNRGSRSFLSNELLRSIARGRSYHTAEASVFNSDFRSQSSLSCDPNAQSQPVTNGTDSFRHGFFVSSNNPVSTSYHNANPGIQAEAVGTTSDGLLRHRKRRRLSWLSKPWSRVVKDGKQYSLTTIPPTTSMSSISKSSISSPVLTSTTNARVADAEKIHCSEILFPISSPPEDHSRGDNSSSADESSTIHGVENASSWTSSMRNIRAKLGHSRRASTGVLLTSSWSRRTYVRRKAAGSSSISSHRKAKLAVRGRLQQLGERLHVLPVETGNAIVDNARAVKAKEIQSHQFNQASRTPTPRATPFLPGPHSDSTTDLLHGSLSKSFASAVGKLDLQSSPTLVQESPSMSTLRKVKTMVGMWEKYDDEGKSSIKSKATPSKPVKTNVAKLSRYEDKTRTFDSPTPREVSETQSDGQVAREEFIGPDKHPDPLRSNPNVMDLASSPAKQVALPKSDSDSEDETHQVFSAPIYSPSIGELSYHTRTPSPPIAVKSDFAMIKPRVPEETPTKQPTFGRLKKSVSGFFIKSASKMRLVSSTSRQAKMHEESKQRYDGPATVEVSEPVTPAKPAMYDHQPFTPSPLRYSSRPDVSEPSGVDREQAAEVPFTAENADGGLKLTQYRSPTTATGQEKRRAIYGDKGFEEMMARQS